MPRPELKEKIKKYLENENFKRILDVGGTQGTYDLLREEFPDAEIFSINIEESDLPKKNRVIGNAENLPFREDYFDLIFAREVLEHIYRPDEFLEDIKKVSKSGGKIVLSTPNLNSWHVRLLLLFGYAPTNYTPYPGKTYGIPKFFPTKPLYDHVRVFPYRALKEIFNQNGFKLESIDGVMMYSEDVWLKKWREVIGKFLPKKWKEGVVLKAKVVRGE